jgi:hypothetical protein
MMLPSMEKETIATGEDPRSSSAGSVTGEPKNAEPSDSTTNDVTSSFRLFDDDTISGILKIPDVEDTSMAHVFAYMEHYQEDLFWSFLSDSFFIAGGIVYVVLSIWDYIAWDPQSLWYKSLSLLGPFVYLINSVVDILWANRVSRRNRAKSRIQELMVKESKTMSSTDTTEEFSSQEIDRNANNLGSHEPTTAEVSQQDDDGIIWTPPWKNCWTDQCNKCRRHAAHRRTVLAAFTFGVAALTDFIGVILGFIVTNSNMSARADDETIWDQISVHVYVLSAIISVTGKRTRPWLAQRSCLDNHETLEDLGDIFFFFGSFLDAVLQDATFTVTFLPVLSSLLWLLDAWFYLLSDFVMAEKFRRHYLPGSQDGIGDDDDIEYSYRDGPHVLT